MRALYLDYLEGELTAMSNELRAAIELFGNKTQSESNLDDAPQNEPSLLIEFEGSEIIQGEELILAFETVSGSLSRLEPDFFLDQQGSGLLTSDLSLLFYNRENVDDDFVPTGSAFLQIGGFRNLGATNLITWLDGGSRVSPVTETVFIDPPIDMNDVVVYRANSWVSAGSWEGEMVLVGLGDQDIDDFSIESLSLGRYLNQQGSTAQVSAVVRNIGNFTQSKRLYYPIGVSDF